MTDIAYICHPLQACGQFRRDLDSLQDGSLKLDGWDTPYDRVALVILADQLSRCSGGLLTCHTSGMGSGVESITSFQVRATAHVSNGPRLISPVFASRNIYRGTPRAFASDGQALRWAGELQDSGAAKRLTAPARLFSIMPYMHSEEPDEQVRLSAGLLTRPCADLMPTYIKRSFGIGRREASDCSRNSWRI